MNLLTVPHIRFANGATSCRAEPVLGPAPGKPLPPSQAVLNFLASFTFFPLADKARFHSVRQSLVTTAKIFVYTCRLQEN